MTPEENPRDFSRDAVVVNLPARLLVEVELGEISTNANEVGCKEAQVTEEESGTF